MWGFNLCIFLRSRSQYIVDGERPTRLFCALEKHNAVQKHVPKLVIEKDGAKFEISEQKAVEAEIFSYYKDLFTEKPVAERPISEFLSSNLAESCKRLTESQKSKMEGLLSIEELTKYLKKTKNNVAPGSTGFSNEFFKFFWADLKVFIVNAINYSYQIGQLSVTQRLGIVTIIPKGDKDKSLLKNWRPLTLLNSMYKLISGCIAERLKPCLDSLIHGDQNFS